MTVVSVSLCYSGNLKCVRNSWHLTTRLDTTSYLRLEMHDEIFHLEIFKNFMKILKYFKNPFLNYFMKLLIFNIKWLKTFKNMIKVYQVSRKYIMLFTHNNKYLPLTGLLTLLQWTIHNTACILMLSSGKIFRYHSLTHSLLRLTSWGS